MNSNTTTLGAPVSTRSRAMPLAMAALLGLFVVAVSGFAPMEAVHSAAHDYRHSMAFPCH